MLDRRSMVKQVNAWKEQWHSSVIFSKLPRLGSLDGFVNIDGVTVKSCDFTSK